MRSIPKTLVVAILLLLLVLPSVAFAATTTTAQRNWISWTWAYNAAGTSTYNCLAYAMGYTDHWEWPLAWGASPSFATVSAWMGNKGHAYTPSSSYAKIICYGLSNRVTHFSKVTGTKTCRAKWGSAERFDHNSWGPYYADASSYGAILGYFK